jgi:hypothetical protein
MPRFLPAQIQGFYVRTDALNVTSDYTDVIDRYNQLGFPLQGVSFAESSLAGNMNWAFNDVKKNVSAKYNNGLSMILPYTYFVPQGSPAPLSTDTAVLGSDGKTALTGTIGTVNGQCMNPFNINLVTYL